MKQAQYSGPATRFSKWGGQDTTYFEMLKFFFRNFRYLEKQFLTLFHLWSLKAYTNSCFYKLTARSGWFKSPLLAVHHGWTARENFEFHPFTNASNGLHETFWYIFSLILFLKSYLLNRSNACTIIFVKWTKLHDDLSNFLKNLSQLQNLRCAYFPPHSNAP